MIPMNINGDVTCCQCHKNIGRDSWEIVEHIVSLCKSSNQQTALHNDIRDLLYQFAMLADMRVRKEVPGLMGSDSRRRPADILVYQWQSPTSDPVMLDITIAKPGMSNTAEETKFTKLDFFKDMTAEQKGLRLMSMRSMAASRAKPPKVPLPEHLTEEEAPDAPYTDMRFCPVAFDHLGGLASFGKLWVDRLAEPLAERFITERLRAMDYVRRYCSRAIAFHLSNRILRSLRKEPNPDLRRTFYKAQSAGRKIQRQRDRQQRRLQQKAHSTLFVTTPVEPVPLTTGPIPETVSPTSPPTALSLSPPTSPSPCPSPLALAAAPSNDSLPLGDQSSNVVGSTKPRRSLRLRNKAADN